MRGVLKYCLIAAAAILLPTLAYAQVQGTLTGTVRDASGAVLPGVTVEATSPAIQGAVRSVVTDGSGIYRINANGGTPAAVTTIAPGTDQSHRWPQFLPDGRHFLFMPWSDGTTKRAVMLGSLDGAAPRKLFDSQSGGVLAGDHILFVLDTPPRVMAWGFDPRTRELRGSAFRLVDDDNVDYHWVTGEPNASAAGAMRIRSRAIPIAVTTA